VGTENSWVKGASGGEGVSFWLVAMRGMIQERRCERSGKLVHLERLVEGQEVEGIAYGAVSSYGGDEGVSRRVVCRYTRDLKKGIWAARLCKIGHSI